MINIKGNEANKYVMFALRQLGVNVINIDLIENDNNVKCFLYYYKKINGKDIKKLTQIYPKNYLRLLSYGIKLLSKGDRDNGVCLSRKNS